MEQIKKLCMDDVIVLYKSSTGENRKMLAKEIMRRAKMPDFVENRIQEKRY